MNTCGYNNAPNACSGIVMRDNSQGIRPIHRLLAREYRGGAELDLVIANSFKQLPHIVTIIPSSLSSTPAASRLGTNPSMRPRTSSFSFGRRRFAFGMSSNRILRTASSIRLTCAAQTAQTSNAREAGTSRNIDSSLSCRLLIAYSPRLVVQIFGGCGRGILKNVIKNIAFSCIPITRRRQNAANQKTQIRSCESREQCSKTVNHYYHAHRLYSIMEPRSSKVSKVQGERRNRNHNVFGSSSRDVASPAIAYALGAPCYPPFLWRSLFNSSLIVLHASCVSFVIMGLAPHMLLFSRSV
ncbi:hypothetical protein BJV78DRAFT_1233822 [Lactifluus subvellereus]|nr:hypothetical protein BJV78DRAFT_1233822 [Lactifluus subvellereus]